MEFEVIYVIVVSAHQIIAAGLSALLADSESVVVVARTHSPEAALTQLKENAVGVVLLDIDSGEGVSGVERLRLATAIPILAVTDSADTSLHDAAIIAGANGVIDKKSAPDALIRAIQGLHRGEFWLDRQATGRVFMELARRKAVDPGDASVRLRRLTRSELRTVLELVRNPSLQGAGIADRLGISEHTLRNRLSSVYAKLELRNRMDLFLFASRHGLDSLPD